MRPSGWIIIIASTGLLTGCGAGTASQPSPAERVAAVRTVTAAPRPLEVTITAVGTVEPENHVVVASQVEGLVTALRVREGDRVAAGEVVAELDDRELVAELAEAQARLVEAESQWRRAETLVAEGLITEAATDSARAAHEVSKARVSALRTRLSFTRIHAPVAGVVTVRHVELGDLVAARTPVVELAAGRRVLRVPVSELDVVKLSPGDPVRVAVDALPGAELAAHVARIFPAADPQSRLVTVEVVLEEVPAALRPGFLARAEMVVERVPGALMLPEPAILRGSEVDSFVYVVEEGVARVREVQVGVRQDGLAHVVSGLRAGERVVVEGGALLRDGSAVAATAVESAT